MANDSPGGTACDIPPSNGARSLVHPGTTSSATSCVAGTRRAGDRDDSEVLQTKGPGSESNCTDHLLTHEQEFMHYPKPNIPDAREEGCDGNALGQGAGGWLPGKVGIVGRCYQKLWAQKRGESFSCGMEPTAGWAGARPDDDERKRETLPSVLTTDDDASGLSSRGSGDEGNPAAGQEHDTHSDEQAPPLATSESVGIVDMSNDQSSAASLPRARWIGKKSLTHQLSAAPELPSDPQALRQLLSDVNNPSIAGRNHGARAYEYESCRAAPAHAALAHATLGRPYLSNDLGAYSQQPAEMRPTSYSAGSLCATGPPQNVAFGPRCASSECMRVMHQAGPPQCRANEVEYLVVVDDTSLTSPVSAHFAGFHDGEPAPADDRGGMANFKRKWNNGANVPPSAVPLSNWSATPPAIYQQHAMMPQAIVHRGQPGRQPTTIAYSVGRTQVSHADMHVPGPWPAEPTHRPDAMLQRGYVFSSDAQFATTRPAVDDMSEWEPAEARAQEYIFGQFRQHVGVPPCYRPAAFRPSMPAHQHGSTAAPVAARQSAFSVSAAAAAPGVRVGVSMPPSHTLPDDTSPIHLSWTGPPVHHALHAAAAVRPYQPEYARDQARRQPKLVQAVAANRAPPSAAPPAVPTAQAVHVQMTRPAQWP